MQSIPQRTIAIAGLFLAAVVLIASLTPIGAARAQPAKKPDAEEILKNFVVVGDAKVKPLPKIGVIPSLASAMEDVTVNNVVRRDLDLCGEFELLPDSATPDGSYLSDSPIDVKAWKKKGAEAVVRVSANALPSGKIELLGVAYLTNIGDKPVYNKRIQVNAKRVRFESHRIADALIGALTGTNGGFTSRMTFIYGTGRQRRVYIMDADGHDPHAMSPPEQVALTPVFGHNEQLQYAASVKKDAYKIFTPGNSEPITFKPRGSVYGIAYSRDRKKVAVSIAQGASIKLFAGPDLQHLESASEVDTTLHPAWSPTGKLAFSGAGRWGQRIYVGKKAVSPNGLNASAPVFCRHPDGIKLIYMVGVGKDTDLVLTGETGGGLGRLTQHMGRNSYPACSPDGRLIAFFSTRKSGQGPGLYIMRIDGRRPKRVSTLVGDSLRWARLPKAPKK